MTFKVDLPVISPQVNKIIRLHNNTKREKINCLSNVETSGTCGVGMVD
jgi:hypothetical protein